MPVFTRIIETWAEFCAVDGIYQKCFGNDSVPTQVQYEWWQKFPDGIVALFDENKVAGGLSYWPLDMMSFEALTGGKVKEKELTAQGIDSEHAAGIYISELAIDELHRKKQHANLLFQHFLSVRKNLNRGGNSLPVLALAYSEGGRRILLNNGFTLLKPAAKMPDHQELYILSD